MKVLSDEQSINHLLKLIAIHVICNFAFIKQVYKIFSFFAISTEYFQLTVFILLTVITII